MTAEGYYLCSHDELPSWHKDNAFIVSGYRRPGARPQDATNDSSSGVGAEVSSSAVKNSSSARQRQSKRGDADTSNATAGSSKPYRHDTLYKCWKSIWAYTHNETVNIHTHFWGALLSIVFLGIHVLHHIDAMPSFLRPLSHHDIFQPRILTTSAAALDPSHILTRLHLPNPRTSISASTSHASSLLVEHSPNDWKDTAGFTIFLICAFSCLAFSSSYHTLQCHSQSLARRFNSLDYVGIVNMIVGSFLPALHYGFYCHPHWQLFYGTCITTLGAGAMWTVLNAKYATPEYRPYRTAVFLALGLSAVVPVAHGLNLYGFHVLNLTMGLNYLVASGALYVAGALLYALRVPERFAPGRFDYFGASHQM